MGKQGEIIVRAIERWEECKIFFFFCRNFSQESSVLAKHYRYSDVSKWADLSILRWIADLVKRFDLDRLKQLKGQLTRIRTASRNDFTIPWHFKAIWCSIIDLILMNNSGCSGVYGHFTCLGTCPRRFIKSNYQLMWLIGMIVWK